MKLNYTKCKNETKIIKIKETCIPKLFKKCLLNIHDRYFKCKRNNDGSAGKGQSQETMYTVD